MRLIIKQILVVGLVISGLIWGASFSAKAETVAELGTPTGYVNDYATVLSESERAELNQQLTAFAQETSNELVVVTVNDLAGLPIEYYATELFAKWQIGQAGRDNGVLLLIAKDEGELRIEVGYGLEGAITDALSYQIVTQKIAPALTAGNYYQGIKAGLDSLMEASQGEYTATEPVRHNQGEWFLFLVKLFILAAGLLNLLWRYLAKTKSWWQGGVIGLVLGLLIATIITKEPVTIIVTALVLMTLGFIADYLVSRVLPPPKLLPKNKTGGRGGGTWFIGGGGGGSSGGFGGFGGGRSGGGGFSGRF